MHHFAHSPVHTLFLHNQELGKAVDGENGAWRITDFADFTDVPLVYSYT
jgi:hypothetical protein